MSDKELRKSVLRILKTNPHNPTIFNGGKKEEELSQWQECVKKYGSKEGKKHYNKKTKMCNDKIAKVKLNEKKLTEFLLSKPEGHKLLTEYLTTPDRELGGVYAGARKRKEKKAGSIIGDIIPFGHLLGLGLTEEQAAGVLAGAHKRKGKAGSIVGDILPFGHLLGLGADEMDGGCEECVGGVKAGKRKVKKRAGVMAGAHSLSAVQKKKMQEGRKKYMAHYDALRDEGYSVKEARMMMEKLKRHQKKGGNAWDSFKQGFEIPLDLVGKLAPLAKFIL